MKVRPILISAAQLLLRCAVGSPETRRNDAAERCAFAYAEIRAQIDHQIAAAGSLDTKLSAVLTLLGTSAAIVATRLAITDAHHTVLLAIVGVVALVTAGFAIRGLLPRSMSYGADPAMLSAMIDDWSLSDVSQATVESLAAARVINDRTVRIKGRSFRFAVISFFVAIVSITPLAYAGGLK